jgi:hypothetical protein
MSNTLPQVDLTALANAAGPLDLTVSPQETVEDAKHRRLKDTRIQFRSATAGVCLV